MSKNKNILLYAVLGILLIFVCFQYYQNTLLKEDLSKRYNLSKRDSLFEKKFLAYEDSIYRILSRYTPSELDTMRGRFNSMTHLLDTILHQKEKVNIELRNDKTSLESQLRSMHSDLQEEIDLRDTLTNHLASIHRQLNNADKNYKEQLKSLEENLQELENRLASIDMDTVHLVSPKETNLLFYGKIVDGKPMGFGVGFYDGGGYYIGRWDGNTRNGKGKHFYRNGDIYEGEFKKDIRSGYGVYFYASGQVFKGQWANDLMNGKGQITTDGSTFEGIWVEGELKKQNK